MVGKGQSGIPHTHKGSWDTMWDTTKPLASFRIHKTAVSLERTGLGAMVLWRWLSMED